MTARRIGAVTLLACLTVALAAIAPPRASAQSAAPVRFAIIGDYGLAGPGAAAVAALVNSWAPDFIATTGDNNYYYGAAATIDQNIGQYYQAYIGAYRGQYGPGSATNRFFPVLGNHDWETPGARPYLDYFTLPGNERYYDVVQGPVHLFMLDSDWSEPDGNKVDSRQAAWLRAGLAASSARWKLVFLHHPPYSSGSHGSSSQVQWPFEEWGAHAVVAGHDHLYERITIGDFPYFINGLGGVSRYEFRALVEGSQVRYAADDGAMLVEVGDEAISFRFISRAGAVVDTYVLYASPSLHPPATPTGLSAVPLSGREVGLTWVDNASNETDVLAEVSTDGVNFAPLAVAPANTTRHELSGLEPLRTYSFRVRARNAAGHSPPSSVVTATTGAPGLPMPPSGLSARPVTVTQIDLAWTDASNNERGFIVERAVNGGPFAEAASLLDGARAYTDTGLDWTASYAYRVRAYNAYGQSAPSNSVASMTAVADLVVTALSGLPPAARPGEAFVLTSSTRNQGAVASRSTLTRFYVMPPSGSPRLALSGIASLGTLAPGQELERRTTVKIPASTPPGEYLLEGCADDSRLLVEFAEGNNCRRGTGAVAIGWPDLHVVTAGNPPASIRRGLKFSITDTTGNQGAASSPASRLRYYLSLNATPSILLAGSRSVPLLQAGQTSTGTASVGIPSSTQPGTYRFLVCADGTGAVSETNEGNNCFVSQTAITVTP